MADMVSHMQTCPQCCHFMDPTHVDEVQFHICPRCRGTWFSSENLTALLGVDIYDNLATRPERFSISSRFRCNDCSGDLINRWLDTAPPVHIHECEYCSGIFLEKGELAALQTAFSKRKENLAEKARHILRAIFRRPPKQ